MPLNKRPVGRVAPAPAPEPETADNVITVSRTFTTAIADTETIATTVAVTGTDYDAMVEQLDTALSQEVAVLREMAEAYVPAEASADEGDAGGADEEPAADAEAVMAMSREQLEALIAENGLDTDPKKFPKNKTGLGNLREAVCAEAFGDDPGPAAEPGTDDGEEVELTAESVGAMDRDALIALIAEHTLDTQAKKYPKLADLRAAVIAECFPDGEEEEEVVDDASSEGYTREDLEAMGPEDLKEIYKGWEMGKYPAGPPAVAKKAAITAILKLQDQA